LYLIIGGDSTIGLALSNYWTENNIPFHASTRNQELVSVQRPVIDLLNKSTFKEISGYKSAVICAAVTDMATCEEKPDETRAVNVTGTIKLIKKLEEKENHIVFLSTNQVFDGDKPMKEPNAPRNPVNEYGRQKAEVEKFIENITNTCILRLSKVIHNRLDLLNSWKILLADGKPIFAFMDMTLSPINMNDVIKKLDLIVRKKAEGIYQLSAGNDISYYEFAQEFAKKYGYSSELVKKDSWKDKLQFMPPMFTSLKNI